MSTLQNILPPVKSVLGVGDFGCPVDDTQLRKADEPPQYKEPLPPREVSEDLAAQYDTEEMHALGWRVVRTEKAKAPATPTPARPAAPATPPAATATSEPNPPTK